MTQSRDLGASLREHGHSLQRLARVLLGTPAQVGGDADDAVQEVWLEALRAPPARDGALGGWLHTVLQHVVWRSRRGARRRRAREIEAAQRRTASAEDHVDVAAREELLHRLVAAVHRLEPPYREVVWLRFFEGLPPREIAARTSAPVATVKSRLLRALEQLRARLAGDGGDADWRGGFAAAFGLGREGMTLTAAWPGAWGMAAGAKLVAAVVGVGIALSLWWWFAAEPRSQPVAGAQAPVAPAVDSSTPLVALERTDATAASTSGVAAVPPGLRTATPTGQAHVRGRLLDADSGEPLVGVEVHWNGRSSLTAKSDDPGAATDSDGRFEFPVPAGLGSLTVVANASGHVQRWVMTGGLREGQVDDLGTVPMRRGRSISARIVDVDGGPVGGVQLEFRFDGVRAGRWLEITVVVEAMPDGSCPGTEVLPFGACTLAIQGGDHELVAPASADPGALVGKELLVTVRRRPTIRGVVVDEAGAPLEGIGLSTQGMFAAEAVTDARGTFTLVRRRPTGDPAATVSFPDTGDWLPHQPLTGVVWGTDRLRVQLRRAATVPIEVVDDSGAALEDYAIALDRAATLSRRHLLRHRGRHDGGRCDVEGVQPGATSLRVVPLDVALSPSEPVALSDRQPVRVVVARRVRCRVQVVQGDAPVAGAMVETVYERLPLDVQHRSVLNDPRDRAAPVQPMWPERIDTARTDVDGIAELWRDVAVTKRALRVQVQGEPDVLLREPVFPEHGALRVDIPETGVVLGRVLLGDRLREDVSVRLNAAGHEASQPLQPDGTFEFQRQPVGPCQVELLLRAGLSAVAVEGLTRSIVLDARQPAEVVFDLAAVVTAKVHGRVVTDGALPAGTTIEFVRTATGSVTVQASAMVGDGGGFAAEGLLPGTYLLAVRLPLPDSSFVPALQSRPIVLVGGEDLEHELRFVRRKLTVRFVHADGTPARGHRTLARCGGARWPALTLFAPLLDETLVLDPAPELPIEFGGWGNAPWSDPVIVPSDRREAEVTVVVSGG